jgi:hypothetical protein
MYEVLTANTPGCVAFSFPVQRRNLRSRRNLRLSRPLPSQRRARLKRRGGFEPGRRPIPGTFIKYFSRDGLRHGKTDYPDPKRSDMRWPEGVQAPNRAFSERYGGILPPTCSDGPTLDAPDCIADQVPRNVRADAKRKLRTSPRSGGSAVGTAPRCAFWPSPHPRIRWTVASPGRAPCARHAPRPPPSRVQKCPTRC